MIDCQLEFRQGTLGLLDQLAVLGQLSSQSGNPLFGSLLQHRELIALQNLQEGLLAGLEEEMIS
jgi:hypothetical protein